REKRGRANCKQAHDAARNRAARIVLVVRHQKSDHRQRRTGACRGDRGMPQARRRDEHHDDHIQHRNRDVERRQRVDHEHDHADDARQRKENARVASRRHPCRLAEHHDAPRTCGMAIEWNERHIFGIGVPRERWCAAFICGIYLRHLFAAFSSGISQPHFSAGGATLIRAATRVVDSRTSRKPAHFNPVRILSEEIDNPCHRAAARQTAPASFALRAVGFEPREAARHFGAVDRFGQHAHRAQVECLAAHRVGSECGDENDGLRHALVEQMTIHVETAHAGHLHVGDDARDL
ncbi:conserved hypothetical protein, partial [Ricinus communis]